MNERADVLYEVASLYYVQHETMSSIARTLGVSRSTISRLLKQARDEGVIRISLQEPSGDLSGLALAFSRIFGVRAHIVNVKPGAAEVYRLDRVSKSAAVLVENSVFDGAVIGMAWGTTVAAVVNHIHPKIVSDTTVVQLNGAMNPQTTGIPYIATLIERVANAFNSDIVHFPVPAFFDFPESKRLMWKERSVRRVLEVQREVDIAFFGVGSLAGPMLSHVYSGGYLDNKDMEELSNQGVVGDVCTVLLRSDGSWHDVSLNSRASGPTPHDLHNISTRICIAAGEARAVPLLAALRAKVATDVVVDDATARAVLDLL